MKNQKGITLVSLVIYVIVMIIVLGIMSTIINSFSNNMDTIQADVQEIVEFNKFNNYFLKEVKLRNNKVDRLDDNNNYILFTSGNSFKLSNNSIYYNNIKICENVKSMQISLGKNGNGQDKTIVNVKLTFETFAKTINYKIEEIY